VEHEVVPPPPKPFKEMSSLEYWTWLARTGQEDFRNMPAAVRNA